MSKKLKQVFERAAKVIEKYGHTKRYYGDEETGFCALGALGALGAACRGAGDDTYIEARRELAAYLPHDKNVSHLESYYEIVTGWNDRDRRRKADVIRKFRQIAKDQ